MPYIGNPPAEKYASYDVQHITTSATSSYVLDKNVANENEIRVVLNNVIQQPGSSYAYTASGNTLTLSAATTSSDKLYVVFTGKAVQTVTPPPSSVGLAQFNATGSPGTNTFLRGDNSWATPSDTVSYLVKISADDTTPDFLNGKLVAGTGISLTEGSGGGDETLTVANTVTSRPNAQALIINGSMNVAQRSANATGLTSSGYKSIDRFYTTLYYTSSNVGTFTQSQSTDVPTGYGFANSLKMDCTTAQGSLPASGQIAIRQSIEAQDLQLLKFGTANAEKFTIAFWVKSNLTGTYNVSLYNQDGGSTPQVNAQYSISSANTWEKKVLVFPADTSNGFNDDNGPGLTIDWLMGTGSTYTGGTAPTTWSAFVNNTFNGGSTVNMASSTSNEWLITGIQMEVGEYTSATIPTFQQETYGNNLQRCQRYYFDTNPSRNGTAALVGAGYNNTTNLQGTIQFPVSMRTAPSLVTVGGTGYWAAESTPFDTFDALEIYNSSDNRSGINGTTNVSGTVGVYAMIRFRNTAARCAFNAEL